MKYEGFEIHASPFITDAYCECGKRLIEVANGLLSTAMYCPKCENVYRLKLIKVNRKKASKKFLKQCREDYGRDKI